MLVSLIALLTAGPGPRPVPPLDLVHRAIESVGGETALRGMHNVTTEGSSLNRAPGQEDLPYSAPSAVFFTNRNTRDLAGHRQRSDIEARFTGFTASTRSIQIATPDAAVLVTNGTRRLPPTRAFQQAALSSLNQFMPVLLLWMEDHPDSLSPAPSRRISGQDDDGLNYTLGGTTTTIWFDKTTGLPLQTEVRADDPILGDLSTVITFSHWTRSAVRFPGQTHSESGRGENTSIQRVVSINDTTLSDTMFAIPDSIVNLYRALPAGVPVGSTATPVTFAQVAQGVWRATGNAYNSMVVEQPDRLVIVEAPLSADYTQSLLDTLAARFPGKRVGWVVNTHHHWDHSGGLRSMMAAGYPVVTQQKNVEFVRAIGTARKTIKPDALSRGHRLPPIIPVADSMTLGSGDSRVELYAITTAQDGGSHIVAFVPSAGVLFESDVVSAPPATSRAPIPKPAAAEIVAIAQHHGLQINQVVGGHGEVASMDAINRAATQ